MVTLTNSTTSTPSVTDGTVSSANQSNTGEVTTIRLGYDTENASSADTLENYVRGIVVDTPTKGRLSSVFAFIDPFSSISGNAKLAVYQIDGMGAILLGESEVFTFTSFSGSAQWKEFTFTNNLVFKQGQIALCLWSDTDLRAELTASLKPVELYINFEKTYSTNFPSVINPLRDENISRRQWQIYADYTPLGVGAEQDSLTKTFGFVNEEGSGQTLEDTVRGRRFTNFPGGKITKIYANVFVSNIDTTAVNGEVKAAVYINGELSVESQAVVLEEFYTGSGGQIIEFTVPSTEIPTGSVDVVLHSNTGLVLRFSSGTDSRISTNREYSLGFPGYISSSSGDPYEIYFDYVPVHLETNKSSSTWKAITNSWDSTPNTWDFVTDRTSLTNI